MLKEAALYKFFSSFGVPAYEQSSVPSGDSRPQFPYITYELKTDAFEEFDTSVLFSIWDNSDSISRIVNLKNAISITIGRSGKTLRCDGGYVLVMRDSPFATLMAEQADPSIKRELCGIKIRYYTND